MLIGIIMDQQLLKLKVHHANLGKWTSMKLAQIS